MAGKFYGGVGYGVPTLVGPGEWEDVITERPYYGDVVTNSRQLQTGDKVLGDISVGNSISIIADEYASGHFHAIKYVRWAGSLWYVEDVQVRRPRLILRLGGVYSGPTPDPVTP